ncbi:MAG: CDP-glycerol glycerophosphotransferase family protein [Candidatus Borkfalkiaceae bacterium]|nr:CDP-glycerol glycerophosphotransferase family protein [Christensenellaceae bacterium]
MAKKSVSRIQYVRIKDVFACLVFIFVLPAALIAKIFIRDFWLVGEDENEARDNGYWFFKWVRENHSEQKIAYVINKKSADYQKVKNLGKIVNWGGLAHWFWYLVAKKNISSQKGCKPNAAACYLFETKLRLWRNNRYFLQHGVIKDNLDWLYYDKCYFKLFCVSAKPEYDYVSANFGYPSGIIECTGLARFDELHKPHEIKKQILVMPTWRKYLAHAHGATTQKDLKNHFTESAFFKKWAEFICDNRLSEMLAETGYTLLFYPHRNMQKYLNFFKNLPLASGVSIANPSDLTVQQALMQSACLITDYSSVFFDFAYMKKPVIFYQFDEEEFRANQYEKGYFDYHANPIGSWCGKTDECLNLLKNQLERGCPQNDRTSEFFEIYDDKNCERIYNAVLTH